jgi:hypothetical protein
MDGKTFVPVSHARQEELVERCLVRVSRFVGLIVG